MSQKMNDGFPVDDVTLTLLRSSCESNPDTGRTHLLDFLEMGAQKTGETVLDDTEPQVIEEHYAEGAAPWSPHEVIVALVDEVFRLRGELQAMCFGCETVGRAACPIHFDADEDDDD